MPINTNSVKITDVKANGVAMNEVKVNGVTVWTRLIDYIYRKGSWLASYNIGGWTANTDHLYIEGYQVHKGSNRAGTMTFTLDVTNASTISVLFNLYAVGSYNAIAWGRLGLYANSNTAIAASFKSDGYNYNKTITIDVSSLTGNQTFVMYHDVGQDYSQEGYNYTAGTEVYVYNIDVA